MAHEAGNEGFSRSRLTEPHLHFTDKLPLSAMDEGADMAAVSMHKSGGEFDPKFASFNWGADES